MREHLKFTIAYDGEALENGTMDVKSLAPALLSIGQLFDAANNVLYGQEAPQIAINVVATKSSCFEIDLMAVTSLLEAAKGLLVGETSTAILNLAGHIGLVSAGGFTLIRLIKFLKGKSPKSIFQKGRDIPPHHVMITNDDGESIIVPIELLRLYRDIAVRKAIEGMIEEPLSQNGIDSFRIIDANKKTVEDVSSKDGHYFVAPELTDTILLSQNLKAAYSIVSLAFKEDNKWRLYDGNNQINALIDDSGFLEKVEKNLIRFAKGDVLICDVTVEQIQSQNGLKTNYTVNNVIEHIPAKRQLDIFIPENFTDDYSDE